MTSSLVGSEMCIRDRTRHRAVAPSLGSLQSAGRLRGMQPKLKGPPQSSPCLLYTSDAADDM
eukprot:5235701-Prorocentrum_lima.AAC.1